MGTVKTEGIIIKEVKYGDSDKIYTLFTKEFGKISAKAKGVCSPESRLMHGTNFLCYSKFILYQYPKSYMISQCDVIHNFYQLSEDNVKVSYAAYFADLINELSAENEPHEAVLRLFLNSLYLLKEGKKPEQLIKFVFELRLMCESGYAPDLTESGGTLGYFDIAQGKLVGYDSLNRIRMLELSAAEIRAMQYVINADEKSIFSFTCGDELLSRLNEISKNYLLYHLEKTPKTLKFLEDIKNI